MRTKAIQAFTIENTEAGATEIYGSSLKIAQEEYHKFDLVVSLEPIKVKRSIWNLFHKPKHVVIQWPDFGVPDVTRLEWEALVEKIKRFKRVLIHCKGGIGRTGTALSIIYGLVFANEGWLTSGPIQDVKSLYIPNAVETGSQALYVAKILGTDVESNVMRHYSQPRY